MPFLLPRPAAVRKNGERGEPGTCWFPDGEYCPLDIGEDSTSDIFLSPCWLVRSVSSRSLFARRLLYFPLQGGARETPHAHALTTKHMR